MSLPPDPFENSPMGNPERTGGSTAVIERQELQQQVEPGDSERFSHYVRKEKIMESAMTGDPVVALCGKVWTPGRDPHKFPVCPDCKAIYEGMNPDSGKGKGKGPKNPKK